MGTRLSSCGGDRKTFTTETQRRTSSGFLYRFSLCLCGELAFSQFLTKGINGGRSTGTGPGSTFATAWGTVPCASAAGCDRATFRDSGYVAGAGGEPGRGRSRRRGSGRTVAWRSGGSGDPTTDGGGSSAHAGTGSALRQAAVRIGICWAVAGTASGDSRLGWSRESGARTRGTCKDSNRSRKRFRKRGIGRCAASCPYERPPGMDLLSSVGRNLIDGSVVAMESRVGRSGIRPAEKRKDSGAATGRGSRSDRRDAEAGDAPRGS